MLNAMAGALNQTRDTKSKESEIHEACNNKHKVGLTFLSLQKARVSLCQFREILMTVNVTNSF